MPIPMSIAPGQQQYSLDLNAADGLTKMPPGIYKFATSLLYFVDNTAVNPFAIGINDVVQADGVTITPNFTCMRNVKPVLPSYNITATGVTDICIDGAGNQLSAVRTFGFQITNNNPAIIAPIIPASTVPSPANEFTIAPVPLSVFMLRQSQNDFEIRSNYTNSSGSYWMSIHLAYTAIACTVPR